MLFLLKLSADREKDHRDLPLLAARTTADALMTRFNIVTQWHGNRPELPRFADEFARQLERHYALTPQRIIPQLNLPKFMVEMLWDTYYPEQDDPPQPAPPRTNPLNPSP